MRIGFTGTQQGMSAKQYGSIEHELRKYSGEFHHGDCIGADAEAAAIARSLGYWIVGHPPTNESKRAFFPSDYVWEAQPYLVRNHDIVDVCDLVIAAPREKKEVLRSGTWATIRYTRKVKLGHQLVLIVP